MTALPYQPANGSGEKVDVLSVLRAEIERAGGEAYPVGRAIIAARAAVAELIEAADAELVEVERRERLGAVRPEERGTIERLRTALANVGAAK